MMAKGGKSTGVTLEKDINLHEAKRPTGKRSTREER